MMMNLQKNERENVWAQKYRPTKVEDTILPQDVKDRFAKFVKEDSIPNLLLSGPHGTGKTTVAIAMLEELECDYIVINGSMNGGIDTLRVNIANFASSVSFSGGKKYVIIDEADALTSHTQNGLRNFIESYSKNCGFIFTCNFKNRIIDPLQSRFSHIDFSFDKKERAKLAANFFKRVCAILKEEGVEHDKKVVASVIEKYFPDFRRVLVELQYYSSTGAIDEGILKNVKSENVSTIFDMMKEKDITSLRKWVGENSDLDVNEIFRAMYELSKERVDKKSLPAFYVTLADYQYKNAFVADSEINLMACIVEILMECEIK